MSLLGNISPQCTQNYSTTTAHMHHLRDHKRAIFICVLILQDLTKVDIEHNVSLLCFLFVQNRVTHDDGTFINQEFIRLFNFILLPALTWHRSSTCDFGNKKFFFFQITFVDYSKALFASEVVSVQQPTWNLSALLLFAKSSLQLVKKKKFHTSMRELKARKRKFTFMAAFSN